MTRRPQPGTLGNAVERLLEPDPGWRPADPAPRQGRLPPEIGKGRPRSDPKAQTYRGLAYAASVPDAVGEFGEFFRYPFDGTPGDYGTRQSYLSSAVPTSVLGPGGQHIKQTVARLTARRDGAYTDTRRGILEGGRILPFLPHPYWVREASGGDFRDTDEVWTTGGDIIWCNNKAVASYQTTADLPYRAMAFPFDRFVIVLETAGTMAWIPRRIEPRAKSPGLSVSIIAEGAAYHPRAGTRDTATTLVPWPGEFFQPAVNQSGTAFAIYNGAGWGKAYSLGLDSLSGEPTATEIYAASGGPSGSYPRVIVTGDKYEFTAEYAQSASDSYVAGLLYDHDDLVVITALGEISKTGDASTTSNRADPVNDYVHAADIIQTTKETWQWGSETLVVYDLQDTYVGTATWTQVSTGPGTFDVEYITDVDITKDLTTRTVLLLDAHNDVVVYLEYHEVQGTAFHESHAHTNVASGWSFRLIPGWLLNDFDVWVPDGGVTGHDPIDPVESVTTMTRDFKLVVRFGGETFEHASPTYETESTGNSLQGQVGWINQGASLMPRHGLVPVMQGMCPYIAYRRPNTGNAEMICAHSHDIDNSPDFLNSVFTEQGVEDWLTSCGVPAAVTTRLATCFRVGAR